MKHRKLIAILAVAAIAPLVGGPAHAASAPADTADHVGLFAQDWNGPANTRTAANWQTAAMTHDVLVGSPGKVYGDKIPQLHTWNPNLVVLHYDLGPYTIKDSALYNDLMANHREYFARDKNGNLITVKAVSGSPAFPKNTLMDQGNPGWQAVHAQRAKDLVDRYGFDGSYVDSMGSGPFTGTTTGQPMNPRTGAVYTPDQWLKDGGDDLSAVKAAIGANKFLFSSGLVNGPAYVKNTHYLSDSASDGIMTDSWMRLASAAPTAYPALKTFQANLDMVEALQNKGKSFFGWTKVWNSSSTPEQTAAWNTFAEASLLLVKASHAYYQFDPAFKVDRTTVWYPAMQAKLGAASGHYAYDAATGVYSRDFANGRVTVNPAAHTASISVN
jgi:hypothetical protein